MTTETTSVVEQAPSVQPPRRPPILKTFIAVPVVLLTLYLASPYVAVYQLCDAMMSADKAALADRIDFRSVREGLKEQLNAAMMAKLQDDPEMANNPFSGFAMALAPRIVEAAVDSYITPIGLSTMLKKSAPEAFSTENHPDPFLMVSRLHEWGFKSPTTFRFIPADPNNAPTFRLKFQDFTWKVIDITLPAAAFPDHH